MNKNCLQCTNSNLQSNTSKEVPVRAIIEIMPMVAIVVDENLNVVESNGEALRLFEKSFSEILSDSIITLSPTFQADGAASAEKAKNLYNEAYNSGIYARGWIYQNSHGEIIPCELTATRFDVLGGDNVICFIRDMRDYYKNLENTNLMEQRLKAMLDASPVLCAIYDENLNITDANKAAATLFGLTDKKIYMNRFDDLCPEFQPCGTPSRKKAQEVIARVFREGSAEFEWMHCTPDKKTMIPCYCNVERVRLIGKTVAIAFVRDMRREKEMIKKLEEIVVREKEASEAKTRFLTSMSHEIRTPMNAVMGVSGMEVQKGIHPPETERAFLRIYNSSNLLLSIINDILDLSKVESGRLEIMSSVYETAELIVNTMQLNMMNFEKPKIKVELAIDENLPVFMIGDELRIKQVLNNLLSNAMKYTEEGEIRLTLSVHQTYGNDKMTLQIMVSDTGQGMTKEQVDSLFASEFTRFNKNENRNVQGSGLGLYITNRLVKIMDGQIYVESEKGVGSTFTVLLPQDIAGDVVLGEKEAERLQNLDVILNSLKAIKTINYEPIPHGKVLIVDDVESNLYVAKEVLRPYQFTMETASDGSEVIALIQNGNVYDIIFMDHMMPVMDGVETTKMLRTLGYKHPIVALSANAIRGVDEMFLESGFDAFVSKPIDITHIERIITKYIRDKESLESAGKENDAKNTENAIGANLSNELMKYFLKDVDSALSVLNSLLSSKELKNNELRSYTVRVHGLKNAFENIGEKNLSYVATELELAGNCGDVNAIVEKTPQFLKDVMNLAQSLRTMIKVEDVDTNENPQFVKEKLEKIRAACESYDMDIAEKIITEVKQAAYSRQTRELLDTIADHILCGDIDEAIEQIDVWLESHG